MNPQTDNTVSETSGATPLSIAQPAEHVRRATELQALVPEAFAQYGLRESVRFKAASFDLDGSAELEEGVNGLVGLTFCASLRGNPVVSPAFLKLQLKLYNAFKTSGKNFAIPNEQGMHFVCCEAAKSSFNITIQVLPIQSANAMRKFLSRKQDFQVRYQGKTPKDFFQWALRECSADESLHKDLQAAMVPVVLPNSKFGNPVVFENIPKCIEEIRVGAYIGPHTLTPAKTRQADRQPPAVPLAAPSRPKPKPTEEQRAREEQAKVEKQLTRLRLKAAQPGKEDEEDLREMERSLRNLPRGFMGLPMGDELLEQVVSTIMEKTREAPPSRHESADAKLLRGLVCHLAEIRMQELKDRAGFSDLASETDRFLLAAAMRQAADTRGGEGGLVEFMASQYPHSQLLSRAFAEHAKIEALVQAHAPFVQAPRVLSAPAGVCTTDEFVQMLLAPPARAAQDGQKATDQQVLVAYDFVVNFFHAHAQRDLRWLDRYLRLQTDDMLFHFGCSPLVFDVIARCDADPSLLPVLTAAADAYVPSSEPLEEFDSHVWTPPRELMAALDAAASADDGAREASVSVKRRRT